MNDKMTDQMIEDLLAQEIPQADQTRKKEAIKMASSEFSDTFHQESAAAARPIDNRNNVNADNASLMTVITKSIRSFFMNTNNNSMAYKGFATAGVAFLAVSVFFMLPSTPTTIRVDELAGVAQQNAPVESKLEAIAKSDKDTSPLSIEEILVATKSAASNDAQSVAKTYEIDNYTDVTSPSTSKPQLRAEQPSAQDYADLRSRAVQSSPYAAKNKVFADGAGAAAPAIMIREQEGTPQPRLDDREEYAEYQSNSIKFVADDPVSTFSIDVDTASYSLVRNQLNNGYLPSPQAVRAEELINYFDYDYPVPNSKTQPFEPTVSVFDSPWNEGKKLVHIGIKGYDIDASEQPDSNIVFLLDVSGSMSSANKLPLVKQSVGLLLDTLKPTDTVSIVVYAGAAGTVLEPTQVKDKSKIIAALQKLNAGGSTAGGAGIELAYQLAEQNFNKDGVNRIILATDGDFNVGVQNNEDLKTLVERKRSNGVFLSILGFGRNNYQDDMMQTLAQNGNGVAAYIDSLSEAKKVLVDEATSTLFPIAKDVKIQVEFNPATVSEYRLVGYETRALKNQDFNNDKVDAGDIGAGHTVTAMYEITPADADKKSIDEPRYAENQVAKTTGNQNEYGFLKMRYKLPNSDVSKLIETPITATSTSPNGEVQFSVAAAGFAQLLTGSKHISDFSYNMVIDIANEHRGSDPFGYRAEFIQLARMAQLAKP